MGKLTTHVLDTANGRPAAGMALELAILNGATWTILKRLQTNADGRTDAPLLEGDALLKAQYRLVFDVAAYFRGLGSTLPEPPFLERVPLRFGIADTATHTHVPLLCSPWGYATYKGS